MTTRNFNHENAGIKNLYIRLKASKQNKGPYFANHSKSIVLNGNNYSDNILGRLFRFFSPKA